MKYAKTLLCYFLISIFFTFESRPQAIPIAASINVGHVAVINPVITLLGSATLALSVVAHNAYVAYREKEKSCAMDDTLPIEVAIAERSYYQERKNALCRLRNQFLAIKCGIEAIKNLHAGNISFTLQFLPKYTHQNMADLCGITGLQERKLSEPRKIALRYAREKELAFLERDIQYIQLI